MVDLKHMRQGILLLILALLIKIAIGASTGTDFCQLEQVKCMGKPHIGCLSNFPVQFTHQSECLGLSKERLHNRLKQFIVTEHNKIRNAVASGRVPTFPSANRMLEMSWDDELEELACAHNNFCTEPLSPKKECRATFSYDSPGENSYASRAEEVVTFVDHAVRSWTVSTLSNPNDSSLRRILKEANNKVGCCLSNYQSSSYGSTKLSRLSCMYNEDVNPYETVYEIGEPNSKCGPSTLYKTSSAFNSLCTRIWPLHSAPGRRIVPLQSRKQLFRKSQRHRSSRRKNQRRSKVRRNFDLAQLKEKLFEQFMENIPEEGHLNIGPEGIKYRRGIMDIARAGMNLFSNIFNPSNGADSSNSDYPELSKLLGDEDYSDEDTDGEHQGGHEIGHEVEHGVGSSEEGLDEQHNSVARHHHHHHSESHRPHHPEGQVQPASGLNMIQQPATPDISHDQFVNLYTPQAPEPDTYNDRVHKSWTSMERNTVEHEIPLQFSAAVKSSSCDIDGVIVEGPISAEDCLTLIRQQVLGGLNNFPGSYSAQPAQMNQYPGSVGQNGINYEYGAPYSPYQPYQNYYPETYGAQSYMNPYHSESFGVPNFRRSAEQVKPEGSEQDKAEEAGDTDPLKKWNVNIQSGVTNSDGKGTSLSDEEVRRRVPEIFNKVLSDLGLKKTV